MFSFGRTLSPRKHHGRIVALTILALCFTALQFVWFVTAAQT
jgi:hypothetical protein